MKNSFQYLFLGFLLIYTSNITKADFITVKDTISSDVTWSADTVKVNGDIVLLDDVTLTINPGTRVEFQGYYNLYIQGTILAVGTAVDSIVFTAVDTNGFYKYDEMDGSWNGILFYNGVGAGGADGAMIDNDTSRFDYCIIEFTKSHPSRNLAWSAIEVGIFSQLVISRSEIRNNYSHYKGGAIRVSSGSDIIIKNNKIHHNVALQDGGGIYSNNSTPVITGNQINYNRTLSKDPQFGKGGGIGINGFNPYIRNNTISHNSAQFGAGIFMSNGFPLIESNTISYNTCYKGPTNGYSPGGGIFMELTSTPLIRSNKIANNRADEAGGIYTIGSKPEIVNNLIVNNSGDSSGGAFTFWDSDAALTNNTIAHNKSRLGAGLEITNGEIRLINNIFWGNGTYYIHLQDTYSELYIENSVIQDGASTIWGAGTYYPGSLLEDNPEFADSSAGEGSEFDGLSPDWSILPGSPCVNAGITDLEGLKLPVLDLQGNNRINHNIIDIGAYEVLVPYISFSDTIRSDTTWIADTVKITGDVVVNDDVILTILPGTIVEFQDTFHLKINGTILAVGLPEKLIRFTVADTSGFSDPGIPDGGWQGIIFDNSYEGMNNAMKNNTPTVLSYCNFSYVKHIETTWDAATITLKYFDGLIISNCLFSDNTSYSGSAGINLERSDISIENCLFRNNRSELGAGINVWNSEAIIRNCRFEGNYCRGSGGAINAKTSSVRVENCEFIRNWADFRGGALYASQTEINIYNNLFANNLAMSHGGAIYAGWETINLKNNVIVNNSSYAAGGGVYCVYSDDVLSLNNTIANNFANNGGGMYTAFCNHRSVNDIMYGNDVQSDGKQYGMYSVTFDLDIRNGLLEGGAESIGFWIGKELSGSFTDLIDTLPWFVNPSEGAGIDFDGENGDWRLFPVSPCINSGISQNIGILIPLTDFEGKDRIYDSEIDMGAYENNYGLPVITRQPQNMIICEGDTAVLSVRVEIQSTFQWQKDGEDIPGADSRILRIQPASVLDDGNYQCIVSNTFGSVPSNSTYLVARAAPEFIRQPENSWAIEGERTIIYSAGTGTPPLQFQWFKGDALMESKTYPDLWLNYTGIAAEARYHCELSNACGTVSSDTVQLYIAPQICMVTVDSNTSDNLVIWEKNTTAPVESYNVYRESIVAGEFEVIGNVPAADLSVYVDTSVNPVAQAYIYKISAIDPDGNESDINLCKPHKTLHLLSSQNSELKTIQCDWDPYYGFNYGTFYIYRGTSGEDLANVHTMASSTTTWIDTEAEPGTDYYYRIIVQRAQACSPTGNQKAGTGPYSHSLSNMDDNKLKSNTGLEDILAGTLRLYPNPTSAELTIEFSNPAGQSYRLTVRDMSGRIVRMEENITGTLFILERGDLIPGLYSIELAGEKVYRSRFIIR